MCRAIFFKFFLPAQNMWCIHLYQLNTVLPILYFFEQKYMAKEINTPTIVYVKYFLLRDFIDIKRIWFVNT